MEFDKRYKGFVVLTFMRRWAFIVFVVGMLVLMLLFSLPSKMVESDLELQSLGLNEKVEVYGEVVSERVIYPGTSLLKLDNGIDIVFEGLESFLGKDVRVFGMVSVYGARKQISAREILF